MTDQQLLDAEDLVLLARQLGTLRAEHKTAKAALFATVAEHRALKVRLRQASAAVDLLGCQIEDVLRKLVATAETVPALPNGLSELPPTEAAPPPWGTCRKCGGKNHVDGLLQWCSACCDGNPEAAPWGVCRICGCTSEDCRDCIERSEDGEACSWTDELENLCTACVDAHDRPKTRAQVKAELAAIPPREEPAAPAVMPSGEVLWRRVELRTVALPSIVRPLTRKGLVTVGDLADAGGPTAVLGASHKQSVALEECLADWFRMHVETPVPWGQSQTSTIGDPALIERPVWSLRRLREILSPWAANNLTAYGITTLGELADRGGPLAMMRPGESVAPQIEAEAVKWWRQHMDGAPLPWTPPTPAAEAPAPDLTPADPIRQTLDELDAMGRTPGPEKAREAWEVWAREVRDPADAAEAEVQAFAAPHAEAEYRLSPLPDGRWAISWGMKYRTHAQTSPWRPHPDRQTALDAFFREARRHFAESKAMLAKLDAASPAPSHGPEEIERLRATTAPEPKPKRQRKPKEPAPELTLARITTETRLLDVARLACPGGDLTTFAAAFAANKIETVADLLKMADGEGMRQLYKGSQGDTGRLYMVLRNMGGVGHRYGCLIGDALVDAKIIKGVGE